MLDLGRKKNLLVEGKFWVKWLNSGSASGLTVRRVPQEVMSGSERGSRRMSPLDPSGVVVDPPVDFSLAEGGLALTLVAGGANHIAKC